MTLKEIMKILEIESEDDFMYFEQFAALMETEAEIDYDTFCELLLLADRDALEEILPSFFEDMIRGIPDDNTDLYSAIQSQKDAVLSLAQADGGRSFGFFADELFRLREWYLAPGTVTCTPEGGGEAKHLSPCEAFMLFREEKLSGDKYLYDFSSAPPPVPDEYILDRIAEMSQDSFPEYDEDDRDDMLDMLPEEYDPADYADGASPSDRPIDPYTEGFVDRHHPVIEGHGIDPYRE